MQTQGKIEVAGLNSLLTCVLCNGYFIDATTIIECLHSFCRTCIVQYLQTNKYCPICEVQVHKTRPLLNIRSDQTLQDIVYKLVPGLFKNEMKRRRDFYSQQNPLVQSCIPASSEKRGDIFGCDRLIFTSEDIISVSLEYMPPHLSFPLRLHPSTVSADNYYFEDRQLKHETHRRYLRCPGAITVHHLKKLLRAKYDLKPNQKVEILYVHDFLRDEYTLTDLAYIYSWRRNGPLRLFYKIYDTTRKRKQGASETIAKEALLLEASTLTKSPPAGNNVTPKLPVESLAPSVAAAPSSQLQRHPSPPSSPRTAEEPDYVKVSKPNSACLLNEQKAAAANTESPLFFARRSSKFCTESPKKVPKRMISGHKSSLLPLSLPNGFKSKECFSGDGLLSGSVHKHNSQVLQGNFPEAAFKSKKSVTFSVDLVQTFYPSKKFQKTSSKLSPKRTLSKAVYRTSPVNGSVRESFFVRNPILPKKS